MQFKKKSEVFNESCVLTLMNVNKNIAPSCEIIDLVRNLCDLMARNRRA